MNTIEIKTRTYTATLKDTRTGETVTKGFVLTAEQLKAAHETGLTVSGLMNAVALREGYRVLNVSAPVKRTITLCLDVNGGISVASAETHSRGAASATETK